MARLTNRQAAALLEFAKKRGIVEDVYRQALAIAEEGSDKEITMSDELAEFLKNMLDGDIEPVMKSFIEKARIELGILDVLVISAVELHEYQLVRLEERLIRLSGRRVEIKTKVDPTILGGLRIVAGDVVIDNSIRTQLSEMKQHIYKGVYFDQ